MSAIDNRPRFPEQITPALDKILGLPAGDVTPLAEAFRAAGHQFGKDPRSEAAFVRFQLVRLATNYPEFFQPAAPIDYSVAFAAAAKRHP